MIISIDGNKITEGPKLTFLILCSSILLDDLFFGYFRFAANVLKNSFFT